MPAQEHHTNTPFGLPISLVAYLRRSWFLLPAFYDLELAAASDMHLVLFRPLHLRLVQHDLCYLEESLIEVSRRFFPARFFM